MATEETIIVHASPLTNIVEKKKISPRQNEGIYIFIKSLYIPDVNITKHVYSKSTRRAKYKCNDRQQCKQKYHKTNVLPP